MSWESHSRETFVRRRKSALIMLSLGAIVLGGCMPHVVYTPSPLVSDKPALPLRVAVQPFKDGTDDPPPRKLFLIPAIFMKTHDHFNFGRPMGNFQAILPPELWSQSFAAELRHSGLFSEVQYGKDFETGAPDILIEGTLQKAEIENRVALLVIFPIYVAGRQDYAISLRALRASDRKLLWSGKMERAIPKINASTGDPYAAIMQSMLLEASQNLVKGLQAIPQDWQGISVSAPAAAPAAGESVEDILKRLSR